MVMQSSHSPYSFAKVQKNVILFRMFAPACIAFPKDDKGVWTAISKDRSRQDLDARAIRNDEYHHLYLRHILTSALTCVSY